MQSGSFYTTQMWLQEHVREDNQDANTPDTHKLQPVTISAEHTCDQTNSNNPDQVIYITDNIRDYKTHTIDPLAW